MNLKKLFEQLTLIETQERFLVGWSFVYFFCLLSGYFILRPIRDEMAMANGASNLQWLFTCTFLAMLIMVPIFGYLTLRFRLKKVLIGSYIFFIGNILIFYALFLFNDEPELLAIVYFIWLSVFNLFAVSLFWSFMADIFSSVTAKKVFGIITLGGSLGALTGPLLVSTMSSAMPIENLLLMAAFFLLGALVAIYKILGAESNESPIKKESLGKLRLNREVFGGITKIILSRYLLGIVLFMLLYTSISTFLYFEQAHILERTIPETTERMVYFSRIDLATNGLAIFGQFFLSNRIIKRLGLARTLAMVPFLIAVGLLTLSANQTLTIIALVLVIHRAGNYTFLRPGREILYTVTSREEKYRAKNFIDTVVYRGGDALTGWLFATLVSLGLGLSVMAMIAIPIALVWSLTGFSLGKEHRLKEKQIIKKAHDEI